MTEAALAGLIDRGKPISLERVTIDVGGVAAQVRRDLMVRPCLPWRSWGVLTETWRVGKSVEDFCRPCKSVRAHTITLLDAGGRPERVVCDTCGSQHNYRGVPGRGDERSGPPMTDSSQFEEVRPGDLEALLRRILREEMGWAPTAIADKWNGGELVLRPGKPGSRRRPFPSTFSSGRSSGFETSFECSSSRSMPPTFPTS